MDSFAAFFDWVKPFWALVQDGLYNFGIRVLVSGLTLLLGFWLIRKLKKLVRGGMEKLNVEDGTAGFLSSFLAVALYIALGFLIAGTFGVDAASIVALLGSAGVTLGLALQGSLSNLAGGILIILLKPFKVGDYIVEDNKMNEGTVKEISLFYTKLQTVDERTVILPNGTLANTSLTNVTYTEKRMLEVRFIITHESDWQRAIEIIAEVLNEENANTNPNATESYLSDVTVHGLCVSGRCYLRNEHYRYAKQRVLAEVIRRFDEDDKISLARSDAAVLA